MKSLEQAIADADTTRGGYNFVEAVKAAARAGCQSEAPLSAAAAAAPDKYSRVVYPFKNERYEIFGASEKELDAKEQALRARYSDAAK
jgi:hypothetical protein